ncbi:hypothetical protein AB0G54_35775 [Streptomyces yokosukanensis]
MASTQLGAPPDICRTRPWGAVAVGLRRDGRVRAGGHALAATRT